MWRRWIYHHWYYSRPHQSLQTGPSGMHWLDNGKFHRLGYGLQFRWLNDTFQGTRRLSGLVHDPGRAERAWSWHRADVPNAAPYNQRVDVYVRLGFRRPAKPDLLDSDGRARERGEEVAGGCLRMYLHLRRFVLLHLLLFRH